MEKITFHKTTSKGKPAIEMKIEEGIHRSTITFKDISIMEKAIQKFKEDNSYSI